MSKQLRQQLVLGPARAIQPAQSRPVRPSLSTELQQRSRLSREMESIIPASAAVAGGVVAGGLGYLLGKSDGRQETIAEYDAYIAAWQSHANRQADEIATLRRENAALRKDNTGLRSVIDFLVGLLRQQSKDKVDLSSIVALLNRLDLHFAQSLPALWERKRPDHPGDY